LVLQIFALCGNRYGSSGIAATPFPALLVALLETAPVFFAGRALDEVNEEASLRFSELPAHRKRYCSFGQRAVQTAATRTAWQATPGSIWRASPAK
jgi:microcystin-dependent protein